MRFSGWIPLAIAGWTLSATAVTSEYAALREELRAFYPDECHSPCKLAAQTNSVLAIARGIDARHRLGGAPSRAWKAVTLRPKF